MHGLALEIRASCSCGREVAVNALAEHVGCDGCGKDLALDPERWRALLREPLRDPAQLAADEPHTATPLSIDAAVVYARQAPRCGVCQTTLPDDAGALAARGWTTCSGCGGRVAIRSAPPWLQSLGIALLVGEDEA